MHLLLDPTRRPVIGHRGDRAHAPENTIESLTQAVALGADAVEFDLHCSSDGIPVLMHDATVDRTTDGTGAVSQKSVAELKLLDAGAQFTLNDGVSFPWRGRGVQIPTLDEALDALPPTLPLIVELKSVEVAEPALAVLKRRGALGRVLVGSFLDDALRPFVAAGVPISPGNNTLSHLYLPALFRRRRTTLPFQAICIPPWHQRLPIPIGGFARLMRSAGGPTHVWTINDPAVAQRLWAAGVNGIITDDPRAILRARGAPA